MATIPHQPRLDDADADTEPEHSIYSDELKPTTSHQRSFSWLEMGSLWVGLVVGVPAYYVAGSLVELGMAWWQGILTVVLANMILLIPLILTGYAGTLYGISFPVLARSSFGIRGAHVPALLRSLIACGWYGIETWIGGQGIFLLLPQTAKESALSKALPWLGTSPLEFGCFVVFWLAQLAIFWNGIDGIRKLENLWATLALNIPDFTRYSKSQKDQIIGQAGLPIFMGAFSFVGLAVTSSTEVIFGRVISNPIQLLGEIGGGFWIKIVAVLGISLATVTTNIAANVVAPANALVNLSPSTFTFQRGALLTAVLGIAFQPWRVFGSSESFVYTWLVGYSALLGPAGGVILADFYLIQNRNLSIKQLYSLNPSGTYWYSGGYSLAAMTALVLGILPVIPGFLHEVGLLRSVPHTLALIYDNSWFFGFFSAGILYCIISLFKGKQSKDGLEPLMSPKSSP
ncbi:unnamed protein product [Coffea canephora]|uniref:Uncharacterized protein n=1 Tax=Coffea canephora TaxID=49390 RepID=A0A068V611_COFCA|nr:unnamed protein product [Coffea canephora]